MQAPESAPGEDELAQLRRRVSELDQQYATSEQKLRLLISVTNEAIAITEHGIVIEISDEHQALTGYTPEEAIGKSADLFVAPEARARLFQAIESGSEEPFETVGIRKDGTRYLAQARGKALEYKGRIMRAAAIRDITEARRMEEAERAAALQEELLRAQAAMIAALSTPLLPISDRVIVMPLIGDINDARAAQIIEALSRGVFDHRAAIAILDITGTTAAGAPVADMLVRAARTVQMLGAKVILTGIRLEVAAALVEIGADLEGIITLGTLQQGVSYALTQT